MYRNELFEENFSGNNCNESLTTSNIYDIPSCAKGSSIDYKNCPSRVYSYYASDMPSPISPPPLQILPFPVKNESAIPFNYTLETSFSDANCQFPVFTKVATVPACKQTYITNCTASLTGLYEKSDCFLSDSLPSSVANVFPERQVSVFS